MRSIPRTPRLPRPLRKPARAWALLAIFLALAAAAPAPAADQKKHAFDIPAGPLVASLERFSETAGLDVVAGDAVEGIDAPALKGELTADEALARLLAGTGLAYRFTGENTIAITTEAKATREDDPVGLDDGAAEGEPGEAQLPETVVRRTAPRRGTYKADRASTATRTDTPILETPASIQVVPRQVIDDQASVRLRDIYRNISGVQPLFTGGNVATTEVPIIRGFRDFSIYRNGSRLSSTAPVDLANIERVEVLKGPASVLFGLGEPGGILNLVTKQPVNDTFAIVEQEFGSYDRYRTTLDANAPLTKDGGLLGRLNFAYTNDDTFRAHDGIDRVFIAPTLTWQPTDATSLTLDFSYSYEEYPFDHGLAFNAEGEPVADVSTFLGEPDFRSEREEVFAGYTLTHDFNDQLTFRNVFMFQHNENRLNAFRHFGSTNADNTVNRTFDRSVPKGTTFQGIADLGYKFELGPTRHHVLAGVDVRWDPKWGNQQDGPRSSGPFPIDIVNPQHGQFGAITFDNPSDFDGETKWVGLYLQDQITLLDDRLHLLIGGRYDHVDQFVKFITPTFNFEDDQTDSAFTARGGALYELTDWLSPYVSVAQSFNPTSPFTTSVDGLDPEEGLAFEGGVKLSFFEERLTSTLAVYHITKDNVPVTDPNNPGFSINGGELRSRGFEADIAGEIAPGLRVIANYAYTDTEVIESSSLPEGSRFNNVPLHSGSVWLSYDFPEGTALDGLGFAGGVRGVSERLGNNAGSFELDGFLLADLAAWYRFTLPSGQRVKAQLNVNNLLDKEYYESSSGTASVFPGAPRTFIASLSIEF